MPLSSNQDNSHSFKLNNNSSNSNNSLLFLSNHLFLPVPIVKESIHL